VTGSKHPSVSVIMPYYNGRKFVREAVQSILNQTYEKIEIVVVDDASSDEKDAEYIARLADEFGFVLIKHLTNEGIGRSMADAFEASHGDLIAELSQDDLYKPQKIEREVAELLSKDLDAVYVAGDILYEDGGRVAPRNTAKVRQIIESGAAVDRLRLKNLPCISIQGLLAKRTVFENDVVPIWRDYLLDDWPVNIRLFERYRVGFIEEALWTSRSHAHNTSRNIWKWLGPQIEVAARMSPEHLRTEGVGSRLASMARRLCKQNGSREEITRLAFAGLMLTESREQHTKAARVLDKIPTESKQAVAGSKIELLENILQSAQEETKPDESADMDWKNLGKKIAEIVSNHEGSARLNEIGKTFLLLAENILSMSEPPSQAVQAALAALMLMSNAQDETRAARLLRSVSAENGRRVIGQRTRILRVRSRPTLKSLFRR
jgi:glycosyltransferase involved in cell wall biosynthesis